MQGFGFTHTEFDVSVGCQTHAVATKACTSCQRAGHGHRGGGPGVALLWLW